MLLLLLFATLSWSCLQPSDAISAYWTPILSSFCSSKAPPNVTHALHSCDQLMDKQLANIFDSCVRSVFRLKEDRLGKPKLCYYARSGAQLDRCKMMKYRSEGITLPELVDREQEHTWCLMKIAQPLGWERLCSDNANDIAFNIAKQASIQSCETRFHMVTKPIKECFNEEIAPHSAVQSQAQASMFGAWTGPNGLGQTAASQDGNQSFKPAACISFQYSRKIWKCLARKEGKQSLQRQANQYIGCLRAIRHSSGVPLKPIPNQLIS